MLIFMSCLCYWFEGMGSKKISLWLETILGFISVTQETFIKHLLLLGTMLDTKDMKVRLLWSMTSQSL